MAETAGRLCDTLLPIGRYRQIVFTFPFPIRLRMAQDEKALSAVLRACMRTLFNQLRRRGRTLGIRDGKPAAVVATQLFGGALNSNVHFHAVVVDGLFVVADDGLRLVDLPPPTDADVQALLKTVSRRVNRLFENGPFAVDEVAVEDEASAIQLAIAEAVRPPRSPRRYHPPDETAEAAESIPNAKPLCAAADGFSIHAASAIGPDNRLGLERMLRYILRPAFSQDRLSLSDDGRVRYKLKRPWVNGATHLDMDPIAFMRRLALLIPKPGHNLLRYFGQFAPNAKLRHTLRELVPYAPSDDIQSSDHRNDDSEDPKTPAGDSDAAVDPVDTRQRRYTWSQLLRRVFQIDVTTCIACGGPMVILAFITDPAVIFPILEHLGLPTAPLAPSTQRNPIDLFDDPTDHGHHDLFSDDAHCPVPPASHARPPPVRWVFAE